VRTLVIGDVHGCRVELQRWLDEVAFDPAQDALVFVGDLVAKGPESANVVRIARELGARTTRGNHDAHCLRWFHDRHAKVSPHHRAVCETLDDADWSYLDATPLYLRLERLDTIVVHAGIDPARPLDAQDPKHLMNMRSIREDGTVSKRIEAAPWASRWPGPARVVFGHDAVRGLQRHTHAIGLDTGCVYGGALTGVVFEEDASLRLHSVSAERVYREVDP